MATPDLTPQQISEKRGQFKARRRAIASRKRYIQYRSRVRLEYQNKLARDLRLIL